MIFFYLFSRNIASKSMQILRFFDLRSFTLKCVWWSSHQLGNRNVRHSNHSNSQHFCDLQLRNNPYFVCFCSRLRPMQIIWALDKKSICLFSKLAREEIMGVWEALHRVDLKSEMGGCQVNKSNINEHCVYIEKKWMMPH